MRGARALVLAVASILPLAAPVAGAALPSTIVPKCAPPSPEVVPLAWGHVLP